MKKIFLLAIMVTTLLPVMAEETDSTSLPKEPSVAEAANEPQKTKSSIQFEKPRLNTQSDQIDMENGVIGIADDRGFTLQSANGKFVFKPYLFLQMQGRFNWYDSEGIDKAYNQDNVANSGFAMPYAILGFTGTTFGRVDYNLCINAAASGGNILQQGWIDAKITDAARFRAGKFKTPFFHAYLTTLGETLFPIMPTSLTSTVIMPYNLNAVNPTIGTGFDLGVEFHGIARLMKKKNVRETTPGFRKEWLMNYEVGLWNGTGSSVNTATKTLSDDAGIPSLLYAGRLTFMPWGKMPKTQGNSHMLRGRHMEFGVSGGINVESQNESTNDTRVAGEFSMLYNRWYVGVEGYWMHVSYTERQKVSQAYNYWGGYAQCGYFFTKALQAGFRWDILDRNGTSTDGFLNSPGVVLNWYINKYNLKFTGMYQYTGRWGHATQLDRDNDDLGIATHQATIQLQYSF